MILIAPNPAWVPRLDGTAGGTALPFPGRKYMLSQVEPGTIEKSCVIASGVSEEMGTLQSRTLMGARKPSTRYLYASNGSVCERVRLISTRLLAPYVQSGQSFGKKDYIPHVHFRFRPGTRKWGKSSLIATIWAFNIRRFERAIP